jgi:hypothetical protein
MFGNGVGALTASARHMVLSLEAQPWTRRTAYVTYFVYAVAAFVLLAVALFIKTAIFDRRPQKTGLFFSLLAIPLLLIYYEDTWVKLWPTLDIRRWVLTPFKGYGINPDFKSLALPGIIIIGILVIHVVVLQRVAVRKRLERVHNPIANFFAGSIAATLVDATLVGVFNLGWTGAVVIAVVFTLVWLGVIALLAALLDVIVALLKYILVWIKRKVFALATAITRASSWLSSLSGRLGLQTFADKIRQETADQENLFVDEQESQDRALFEAYLRDRAHRRRLIQGGHLPPEPDDPAFQTPAPAAAQAAVPAEPAPPTPAAVTEG